MQGGEEYMQDLYITDLIDRSTLQRIQDAFSNMVGMAALTTDERGNPVTEGSNFTQYCMDYTRRSKVGCVRCEECDRYGAVMTRENGRPTSYVCHSGLIDFAAPIMADDRMVGSFIGGQVLAEPPDRERIRQVAEEIGVDFDEYWAAIGKVQIIDKGRIESATEFLYMIASVLSDMAMSRYRALQANEDIRRAAKMKTDFLANMSHEIRTPMNAVIGMAEMALHEEISDNARNYISQIKSSGRALLAIVNDILDFSRLDSGKLEVNPIEYESMSLFNDVSNIVMTRMDEKDVELDLDISVELPHMLYGDNIRIRQVLTNLANNAVKFTNQGMIRISIGVERKTGKTVLLHIMVEDTGIGVREEDLDRIFESFSQVNSKRNREVEGSGLGLALSQRLVTLMGGSMQVESVYGEGSRFGFTVPQKVMDEQPAMQVDDPGSCYAVSLFDSHLMADAFLRDTKRLGVEARNLAQSMDLDEEYRKIRREKPEAEVFLFYEPVMMGERLRLFLEGHPEVAGVCVTEFIGDPKLSVPNVQLVKKPLSAMNLSMIFNRQKVSFAENREEDDVDFIAPEARVLIVDDNAVNLTVAEGLLEPLKMNTETAQSGAEALLKTKHNRYDIVFMDHMMPEMDGIEATRAIRRMSPEYGEVPIIALTANAIGEAREMFLSEGLNDFIPKPIEVRNFIAKVKQWLPPEKIQKVDRVVGGSPSKSVSLPRIGDLDLDAAMRLLGDEKLLWSTLGEYYRTIRTKARLIREYCDTEDWKSYTIEVHALKSASKLIGATQLSSWAATLEKAGHEGDIDFIRKKTEAALEKYLEYDALLEPYCKEEKKPDSAKKPIGRNELAGLFGRMRAAVDDLDMDEMEFVSNEISGYRYPKGQEGFPDRLHEASDNLDVDACLEIIDEWEALL